MHALTDLEIRIYEPARVEPLESLGHAAEDGAGLDLGKGGQAGSQERVDAVLDLAAFEQLGRDHLLPVNVHSKHFRCAAQPVNHASLRIEEDAYDASDARDICSLELRIDFNVHISGVAAFAGGVVVEKL